MFSSNNIYFCKCQKAVKKNKKKSKANEQTLEELNIIRLIAVRKQNVSQYKPVTLINYYNIII